MDFQSNDGGVRRQILYLALLDPTDEAHQRTLALSEKRRARVITTAWVLTQALTGEHHLEQAGFGALLGPS